MIPGGRQFHLVSLVLLVFVVFVFWKRFAINVDSNNSELREQDGPLPSSGSAVVTSNQSDDEVERITLIVDALPHLGANGGATLKYGFEWVTPERSTKPVLATMTPADAETGFYNYIQSLQIKCPEKTRIGRNEDGGWDACIAGPFGISQPCLVYSIGMGGEWSFDHMITDKYKCLDMAYDPTLGKGDHKPKDLLWFYNTGLGIANTVNSRNWKLRTFGSLLEENGHSNRTIDILKIDIEYSEWESLEAIFTEQSLRNVRQLMVEFHTMEVHEGRTSTSRNFAYYYQILRGIDRLGFKQWHYLMTPTGGYTSKHTAKKLPCCANVYFVNTVYLV